MYIIHETNRLIAELLENLAITEKLVKGFKYDARINYRDQYLIAEAKDNDNESVADK